jgi:two-component system chemotaxis sensor kinase CheA
MTMENKQDAAEMLDGLSAQVLAAEPSDKDEIVRLGSAIEGLLEPAGQVPTQVEPLLALSLEAMQGLYQQTMADPSAALEAVATALCCAHEQLSDPANCRGSGPTVQQASESLHRALAARPSDSSVAQPPSAVSSSPSGSSSVPVQQQQQDQENSKTQPGAAVPQQQPQHQPQQPPASAVCSFSGPAVLPADADMDLLKEYIVECMDHIAAAEASLLDLEVNPDGAELINTIFRAFHTIKGTSGFLGLDRIQKLAHLAESLLNRGRDGQIKIRGGYADLALKSCDSLRTMIEALRMALPGQPLTIPSNLEDLLAELADPESHGISDESQPEALRLGDILVSQGAASRETVEQVVQDKGNQKTGQALVESGAATAEEVAKALRTQKKIEGSDADSTIRVGTARLDSLVNMVGELVIAQSMVAQDRTVLGTPDLSRKVTHADKIVRELQDLGMSLRMVPLQATFQKMARLVRDLGRKSDKSVQFVSEGEDTEIDRSMVEVLSDPLVHMIRNSVDHGIEPKEDRVKAGKEPTGTVTLRAYHAAGKVVIELCDDGRGLNKEKIQSKAIEKGLVPAGRELTEGEIFGLIFQPGFSTADKVTDISGRGVGMDVVRKGIDSLRGQIDVSSTQGAGSTFQLRLPLTMAISDAMLVQVGRQTYLLPTISIEHSFRPTTDQMSTVVGQGEMVLLRGQLLPIIRLHRLFNIPGAVTEPDNGLLIVLESQAKRCAVMVDKLLGQQQVVIKSLGSSLANVPGVAGAAILGDGRVGLILDPTGIAELSEQQASEPTAAAA